MTRGTIAGVALIAVLAGACAPRVTVPPVPTGPRYPDFVYPAPPARVGDERTRTRHDAAWRWLQLGDLRTAEDEFAAVLTQSPAFFPAAVGWGYVLVAGGKPKDALVRFEQAVRQAPRYAPALAGRAEALLAAGQREQALVAFEAALSVDGSLADIRRRVDVLKFDRVRERVASAKRLADAGRLEEARQAYEEAISASPESAFLYRDLGMVELRQSALDAAIGHLRKSVLLDPSDMRAHLALVEALEKRGDVEGATGALERAYALEPSDALKQRLDRSRERAEVSSLPADYAAIVRLPQVTRGDLAALLGVRLRSVITANRNRTSVVATDIRGHWASTWIVSVTRAGLMDVFPNHTFQPRAVVRRADVAEVVSRALTISGAAVSGPPRGRVPIGDVGVDHLHYAEISLAVAAGVLALEGTLFRPSRVVSGQEAIDVVQRLERLTAPGRRGNR
jgi:tetratricopeptide (TPR) repeat protein